MILDPRQTDQLPEVVAEGGYYGMQTFDQALLKHLQAGRITVAEAMGSASAPHDFKLMIAAASRSGELVLDTAQVDEPATGQDPPPMRADLATGAPPVSQPAPAVASAAPPGFA